MQIFSFLFDRHLERTVLAVAIALSVFMLTRPEDGRIAAARSISSFLLYPVSRTDDYFTSVEELTAENDSLRTRVVSLSHENERLTQFRDERNRLRELLGFRKDSFFEFMPCDVIARSSSRFHHSITVDRGSDSGVLPGMPVVGYRGLAGKVTQVFPSSSRVLLLNNKSVSVSCLVKRSRVVGVLAWERGSFFSLDYVGKEEDVLPGDTLITSGFGRVFPKGFPVGTVFHVAEEKTELSRRVGIVCMTDLNKLEEVFIIIGGRDWKGGEAWLELEKNKKDGEEPEEGKAAGGGEQ
ncbi:MAG: rod shape-determining protein MreC [Candidatus Krumholzibacteria bacterium]|nr:rod shape-determining protein MreC [Candidatus Krumholzibacteria bacterium]